MSNNRRLMSNNLLMNLLFPAIRLRLLAVLLLRAQQTFHVRDLARQCDAHAGTVARELDKLSATGLLLRSKQGNQVRYQADRNHLLFPELAAMFRKTFGIVPALSEALLPLDTGISLAFVYGSVAAGTQQPGSDVDLLVVGDIEFAALVEVLYPLHQSIGREINPALYSLEEWRQRLQQGGAFVKALMSKPRLWVKGNENDLAEFVSHTAPSGA
jgi:predicted nucleotidyltransferase